MTEQEKQEHREIYPLPYKDLCLHSSFEQILGRNNQEYTLEERKERWNKVMNLDEDMKEVWSDTETCNSCKHLKDNWCSLVGLPCTVNPTLTFRHGIWGMACQGVGFENKQLEIFE